MLAATISGWKRVGSYLLLKGLALEPIRDRINLSFAIFYFFIDSTIQTNLNIWINKNKVKQNKLSIVLILKHVHKIGLIKDQP